MPVSELEWQKLCVELFHRPQRFSLLEQERHGSANGLRVRVEAGEFGRIIQLQLKMQLIVKIDKTMLPGMVSYKKNDIKTYDFPIFLIIVENTIAAATLMLPIRVVVTIERVAVSNVYLKRMASTAKSVAKVTLATP